LHNFKEELLHFVVKKPMNGIERGGLMMEEWEIETKELSKAFGHI